MADSFKNMDEIIPERESKGKFVFSVLSNMTDSFENMDEIISERKEWHRKNVYQKLLAIIGRFADVGNAQGGVGGGGGVLKCLDQRRSQNESKRTANFLECVLIVFALAFAI